MRKVISLNQRSCTNPFPLAISLPIATASSAILALSLISNYNKKETCLVIAGVGILETIGVIALRKFKSLPLLIALGAKNLSGAQLEFLTNQLTSSVSPLFRIPLIASGKISSQLIGKELTKGPNCLPVTSKTIVAVVSTLFLASLIAKAFLSDHQSSSRDFALKQAVDTSLYFGLALASFSQPFALRDLSPQTYSLFAISREIGVVGLTLLLASQEQKLSQKTMSTIVITLSKLMGCTLGQNIAHSPTFKDTQKTSILNLRDIEMPEKEEETRFLESSIV
ncbi:hypothetical protein HOG98_08800 [bacterium]|jgi:hypothetical protein|nr:hypothetical protein [bacterium]